MYKELNHALYGLTLIIYCYFRCDKHRMHTQLLLMYSISIIK